VTSDIARRGGGGGAVRLSRRTRLSITYVHRTSVLCLAEEVIFWHLQMGDSKKSMRMVRLLHVSSSSKRKACTGDFKLKRSASGSNPPKVCYHTPVPFSNPYPQLASLSHSHVVPYYPHNIPQILMYPYMSPTCLDNDGQELLSPLTLSLPPFSSFNCRSYKHCPKYP